jgi:TetR/AcrR family acrAB operon transcriptional repressor
MRKTKAEADKTKQALIKSAWHILSQKGYAAARLSDIANDAGVTRGAIYWHFGNKENLLIELIKERADSYFKVISEVFDKEITPLEKINEILVSLAIKIESDDQFKAEDIMMIHREDIKGKFRPINKYIQQKATEYSALLARIIMEGQQKGEIRKGVNPQHFVLLLFIFMGGLAKLSLRRHAPPIAIPDSAELVDLFLKGITADQ